MKYIVILGDGMADYAIPELGNQTPLQAANKPNMDYMAAHGTVGLVKTIPDGMPTGSDTANLSVMGYDPRIYYSGRSPLEAVSMGIALEPDDVTFRCNFVSLDGNGSYENCSMLDYSSDEITSEEAAQLVESFNEAFGCEQFHLYPGISYRHCLVMKHGSLGSLCTPPHDILGKCVTDYLPGGTYGELLYRLMVESRKLFKDHPVNVSRRARGLHTADSCWFWGEGTKPQLTSFSDIYHCKGGVIAAVDLIKGIGKCAGLTSVDVPDTTGNINTNFKGKADAAVDLLLNGYDYVYVHMEAPDECGHRHEIENKVRSIELIDRDVLGRMVQRLKDAGEEYSVLILPDHPTPLSLRTHTGEPVPFVIYRSNQEVDNPLGCYNEQTGKDSGIYVDFGFKMVAHLFGKPFEA